MTLPVLISIPHGGTRCPREIEDRVCITSQDLFDDIDPCTNELYDIGADAVAVVSTDVARSFVDMNRAPNDRPPTNPDGVVKTMTCHGRPIYHEGQQLTEALVEEVIARYHTPYHGRLEEAARHGDVRLALDCHSMSRFPPTIAPDRTTERPLFCLSNGDGLTCSHETLEALADALASAFECDSGSVRLNHPFKGGYITRRHGVQPIEWVQVEMNRKWYLADPWFDPATLRVEKQRLDELRMRFRGALSDLTFR